MILNLYRYKYYNVFFNLHNYMTKNKTFKHFKTKRYTYNLINDITNNKNKNDINNNIKYYNNKINNKKRLNLLLLYKYYYKDNIIKQHKKRYAKIIKTII